MLGDLDVKRVRDGLAGLDRPLVLTLHPSPEMAKANSKMAEVIREFEMAAGGQIVIRPGSGQDLPGLPALTLEPVPGQRVCYMALPEGPEALPFIELLLALARAEGPGAAADQGQLELQLDRAADVQVFIASACPHCPQAVRAAIAVALADEHISLTIIDSQFFEDLAARYAIKSVPCTVLDEGYSFVGVKSAGDLAQLLRTRDSDEALDRLFLSCLEGGRFPEAARLVQDGKCLEAFRQAWAQSTTSTRMGLLLTVEQALEAQPGCLDGAVSGLVPLLQDGDAALRGDTADLLGQIGHASAAGPLKALLADPNPDVVEIAEEAIDAIMERS